MTPQQYTELLKDPRWQKRRLEIFQRDNWTCQICDSTKKTLHLHHVDYLPDTEPWDYPDYLLVTLCKPCHDTETKDRAIAEQELLSVLRRGRIKASGVRALADKLRQTVQQHSATIHTAKCEISFRWGKPQE